MSTMNSYKKSTFPFFESICVFDGNILYPTQHEVRYKRTYINTYGKKPMRPLLEKDCLPLSFPKGKLKLKIAYNAVNKICEFAPYDYRPIQRLQCVEAPYLNYKHKYTDRKALDTLLQYQGKADDVLILQDGWVRDSSYTNICFWDGIKWFTPATPLLEGTVRQRLLDEKKIFAVPIHTNDFQNYTGFKLINALRSFEQESLIRIQNILLPV